jgi:protein-disulfide isomerase
MSTKVSSVVREEIAREARRRRTVIVSIVAAVAVVAAGLTGWAVYETQKPRHVVVPASASADGTGVVVSDGPVRVDAYVDLMCPHCKEFEDEAATTLNGLVAQGKINLVYHPIAILDGSSHPAGYSTRAGAAAGAAADGGKFLPFLQALYAQQPAEGSAGLSDDQLIKIGEQVGLTQPGFATEVRDGKYKGWMASNTDKAAAKKIQTTPTVLVAGKPIAALTPNALQQAVDAVSP